MKIGRVLGATGDFGKLLLQLLKMIFNMKDKNHGHGNGAGEPNVDAAKELSSKLDLLSRSLLLEKMDCLQEGNQLKADMFNAAIIASKTFSKDLAEFGATKKISFEEITKKITDQISVSLNSDASVSAFNDFRNRGEKPLVAVKEFSERLSAITSDVDFGQLTNKVNEVSLLVCNAVGDHYSQSPLTPRQQNGLDPIDSPENDNELRDENDHSLQNESSNDNSGPGRSI